MKTLQNNFVSLTFREGENNRGISGTELTGRDRWGQNGRSMYTLAKRGAKNAWFALEAAFNETTTMRKAADILEALNQKPRIYCED